MGDSVFYRVRTRVAEAPGALAVLAQKCGEVGVNILGLQIYPELGSVTDDLVVRVPEGWTESQLVALVESAGGSEIQVRACGPAELQDQPLRWLSTVRQLIEDPSRLEELLDTLVGSRETLSGTEAVRVVALEDIVEAINHSTPPAPSVDAVISFRESEREVLAMVGQGMIGAARWEVAGGSIGRGYLEVAPAWQRMGVGSQLLRRVCGRAALAGMGELVLVAPANDEGVVPMLAASGMRGRIRLTSEGLQVRIGLTDVRRVMPAEIA